MRMVAADRLMLVTLWGLAIASVVAFPGQALVTRTADAPIRFHKSVPSITMSSSGAPGRKKTTQIGASSLPMPHPRDPVAARAGNLAASAIAKLRNSSEVTRWRMAAATFVSSIVVMRPVLDASLVKVWSYIQGSSGLLARCFRHDHWEWGLAVACFLVWIHGFWYADKLVAKAGRQGRFHPWRKFRLQDRYEAQKLHHQQVRQMENGKQVDTNAQPPLVTRQSEWNWQAWIFELPVYIVPLFLWDILIPRRAWRENVIQSLESTSR